jgi:hypothetical protein
MIRAITQVQDIYKNVIQCLWSRSANHREEYTMLTQWFLSRGSLVCYQASPRCVDQHLDGSSARLSSHWPLREHQDTTHKWGNSMRRSTIVPLRDPRGMSTIPLTNPSPELRTISLRASTEPQSTKPSRSWQLPRVTCSTACNMNT